MKAVLSGVYPPIPTPFTEAGDLDLEALAFNMERWNQTGLSGYVVLGSNGEAVFLTEKEKLQALEAAVEHVGTDKEIIAGTGCESTAATVDLTQAAAELGAVAALVVNPHFYSLSEAALVDYYTSVAESSPIPVMLYNVPKFTGANMAASLVVELSAHPNIVGIKDSSGNLAQMSSVLAAAPKDFRVFTGTANVLYAACAMGCAGAISALANLAPEPLVDLVRLVQTGRHTEARESQLRLLPANIAVTATYGVPGLKAGMTMCGYRGGFPRPPLLPLSASGEEELRSILTRAELL